MLFDNRTECTILAPNGFHIRDEKSGVEALFPESSSVAAKAAENKISIGGMLLDGPAILEPQKPFVFLIDGQGYRGNLILRIAEPNQLQAINTLPLESYLWGVVGAEMHSYWESQALQSQSIAARTYAVYAKKRYGKGRDWDVTCTQANQVYRGLSAETATVRLAVYKTGGMVLARRTPQGQWDIFPSYYSSSCGGHTEDSQPVFGEAFSPLQAVECPWCQNVTKAKFRNWGPVEYSIEEIHQKLVGRYPWLAEKLGKIVTVEIVRTGEDFRLALDSSGMKLKSTLFSMKREGIVYVFYDGRGFGHGVGLCQAGAEYMARDGKTYTEILAWYYPGAKIMQLTELK